MPPGEGVSLWGARVLEQLALEPSFRLRCRHLDQPLGPPLGPGLLRILRSGPDPFASGPLPLLDAGRCQFEESGAWEEWASAQADPLATTPDLWLWLGEEPPPAGVVPPAPLGLWAFSFGDPERPLQRPYFAREVIAREPLTRIVLHRELPDGSRERIAEAACPTQRSWDLARNVGRPLSAAAELLHSALLDLRPEGAGGEPFAPEPAAPVGSRPLPLRALCRFVLEQSAHSLRVRLRPRRDRAEGWYVMLRSRLPSGLPSPEPPIRVPAPAGIQYADPFLADHDGRSWLFVEEIRAGVPAARLVALEIFDDHSFGPPHIILERPSHLSYPCVFRHQEQMYLLPESGSEHSVRLFRATHFPFAWEEAATLDLGSPLCDTTPLHHQGRWYFFTTLIGARTETFLFTAEQLHGPWHYHPANPICTDARRSRGAGAIFSEGGALIRPAQDCLLRYGARIVLNRIVELTPERFREEPCGTIEPDRRAGAIALHTINRSARYEVVDCGEALGG